MIEKMFWTGWKNLPNGKFVSQLVIYRDNETVDVVAIPGNDVLLGIDRTKEFDPGSGLESLPPESETAQMIIEAVEALKSAGIVFTDDDDWSDNPFEFPPPAEMTLGMKRLVQ